MSNFLKNKALGTYFLLDALISKDEDRKALLKKLTSIFCVRKQSIKLYDKCCCEEVADINSVAKYYMHLRFNQYYKLDDFSEKEVLDDEIEELISIKGNVLVDLAELKILTNSANTHIEVMLGLSGNAENNIVTAMYAYGIILCEGLGVEQNMERGVKYLKRAADWGNIGACIMCIYYCRDIKELYGSKLYTFLQSTPYGDVFDIISLQYVLTPAKDEPAALLVKLFAQTQTNKNVYDLQIARLLDSDIISKDDKQDLLLSGGNIKAVNTLPLSLKSWNGYEVRLKSAPSGVEREIKAVELALKNLDTLSSEKYRPLCISSDESYMLSSYLKCIKATFSDCNVIVIDAASEMSSESFYNAILKGIDGKKRNVAVIELHGKEVKNINVAQLYQVLLRPVLCTPLRSSFKVTSLNVSLNLTELLPVILCDRKSAAHFRTDCQVIRLSSMTEELKREAILDSVNTNSGIYELHSAKIEDDAMARLMALDSNDAMALLDKMFAQYDDGSDVVITLNDVNKEFEESGAQLRSLGFN